MLSAALHFYLHYTAALVILAEIVAYVLAMFAYKRQLAHSLPRMLLDAAVLALLCLPAASHLMRDCRATRELGSVRASAILRCRRDDAALERRWAVRARRAAHW